jgi:ElaB/YqjD/DUF883 family membrane-anchored ribosome-binding protein
MQTGEGRRVDFDAADLWFFLAHHLLKIGITLFYETRVMMENTELIKGETVMDAQTIAHEGVETAKNRLGELGHQFVDRTKSACKATNSYVHENPWRALGIGAGLAAGIGILIGLALGRQSKRF